MGQTVVNQGASGPGVVFKKRAEVDFGSVPDAVKIATVPFDDGEMVVDAGDGVFWSPAQALDAGILNAGARCSATGVVSVAINNLTGSTVQVDTVTMDLYVIKGGLDV